MEQKRGEITMNRESEFGMPSQRGQRESKCGYCNYHRKGDAGRGEGWMCMCDTSDNYLDETDYNCSCPEFEERARGRF